jgi:hypothetical protein
MRIGATSRAERGGRKGRAERGGARRGAHRLQRRVNVHLEVLGRRELRRRHGLRAAVCVLFVWASIDAHHGTVRKQGPLKFPFNQSRNTKHTVFLSQRKNRSGPLSVLRGAALCSGCAPRGGAETPPFAIMAAATNQNLFPDLHHKMSKKIAQLTKVIYHLNSKNEEHTDDLTSLADAYETEIDGVRLQFRGPLPPISQCPRPRLRSALRAPAPCARFSAVKRARRCIGRKCGRWRSPRFVAAAAAHPGAGGVLAASAARNAGSVESALANAGAAICSCRVS